MAKFYSHQEQQLSTCHLWFLLWLLKFVSLFIYPGRADWAHWHITSNTLLLTHTAAHADTRVQPNTTLSNLLAEQLGAQ